MTSAQRGDRDIRCAVVVVGAGPAGRGLAHRAQQAGLDVVLVDRSPDRAWRATLSAWSDELPEWIDPGAIAERTKSVAVYSPGHHTLHRGYTVFDTAALQRSLAVTVDRVVQATATRVRPDVVDLDDGRRVFAGIVVDARGSAGAFGPEQTAYGVFVSRAQAGPLMGDDAAVLMDWRPFDGTDRQPHVPSFLYTVPVSGDRVLLEETCLVGNPALSIGDLRERLRIRLAHHGVDVDDNSGVEQVHFPVAGGGPRPWSTRPAAFGARGGLMHPATGYSVAPSLHAADRVVATIARGDDVSTVLWPVRTRLVHTLRRRGLNALLGLEATSTVEFFDAFFALPPEHQRAYLSSRDDARGVMAAMLQLMRLADARVGFAVARGALLRR